MTTATRPATIWRLDTAIHAASWHTGEGAFRVGGRWNSPGVSVVYCSIDPSTAILEVAVHKGFNALDRVAHKLISIDLTDPMGAKVVQISDAPNPNWFSIGIPSPNQQLWGDDLIAKHPVIFIPSVVCKHSWNVLLRAPIDPALIENPYQENFGLDTRLLKP